jgi:L-iditol 2-dehydrogenase
MVMMKAAVLHAKEDIRVEQVEIPEINENEVLVKVKAAGICGSDIPRVLGNAAYFYPIILGHEFSGEIVEAGSRVAKVKVGARVAGAPLLPCYECEDCKKGHYGQCLPYSFLGSKKNGGWAEYVKMPEVNAVILPDTLSFEEGSFLEPTTVALHALRHMNFMPGENVIILGMGTIGLLTLQCVKIFGAKSVTVVDIDETKLQLARKFGADHCIDPQRQGLMETASRITNKRGYEIVLETAGSTVTMVQSFELAAGKANICFIGTPHEDLTFDHKIFEKMNRKEFRLTGSWMSYSAPFPGREWELAAQFLNNGQVKVKEMIDRKVPLERAGEIFELYKKPGAIKGKVLFTNSDTT